MKKTLTFIPSTIASTQSKMNVDAWDTSLNAFDNKEYLGSFHALLDYINPGFRTKYGNADGTQFTIPHGSIMVNIRIEDNRLKIDAPFLALPEKNKIAFMRQVATLNMNNLILTQLVLKEDKFRFEYSCPLSLAEPYKIYYTLEDICYTGDKYDDEFAEKFGAVRIYEPKIEPYSQQDINAIYDNIRLSCEECKEALIYFESNRKYGFAWNVVTCTILKILYYSYPQGQLLNNLNKAIYDLDREDMPLSEIVEDGKKEIEKLQAMSKEELAENLYYVETFIPAKRRSNLKNIQDNFNSTYEKAEVSYGQKDYMSCYLMITHQFYRLYFYNNVQDDVNAIIVDALQRTSAEPFETAAPILFNAMKNIMNGNLNVTDKKSKESEGGGFRKILSSLFGNSK